MRNKAFVLFLFFSYDLHAYLGPGMAGGGFIATLAIIGTLALAIVGIIFLPLKRFYKNRFKK